MLQAPTTSVLKREPTLVITGRIRASKDTDALLGSRLIIRLDKQARQGIATARDSRAQPEIPPQSFADLVPDNIPFTSYLALTCHN